MAETTNSISIRDIKTKRPWRRYLPQPERPQPVFTDASEPQYLPGLNYFEIVTQANFLSEYYPSAHKINSESYYPNVWRTVAERVIDPTTGEPAMDDNNEYIVEEHTFCELVPRISFPFQQIIALTHIYHATTNDVQHELAVPNPLEAQSRLFDDMCASWTACGMEEAWYESYKSREITGDTAFVGILDKQARKFYWRVFSFKNGDILYPHYDRSGRMNLFARSTHQYNEDGETIREVVEVWDDFYYYVYTANEGNNRTLVDKVKDAFGLDSYNLVLKEKHGFRKIPVKYMRNDDGPGWSPSQDACDNYELTFSQMAHNNQAYGEAILVTKSKGDIPVDITRGLNGTIKQIDMDSDSDAHFLEGQSASDSYIKQLEKEEEMIYRGSSIIKSPTELKAGDTPATAIKLLFTPNMERATADLAECKPFLDGLWEIFAEAYGNLNNCILEAQSLPVLSWGVAFVPQSESSIVADLVSLVNSKIISAKTAAERCPFYSKPGEQKRVEEEEKRKRDAELLVELNEIRASTKARIAESKNNVNTDGDDNKDAKETNNKQK